MDCHHFESPISTLKVDFGCSKHCPMDVKKNLQRLKGVKSISIDPSQGKVTVVGNVNPMMLVKLLQKMGKKAQLWSFDKAPMQGKAGCHAKQSSHCCCESDSENDCDHDSDEESISWENPQLKGLYGQKSKKKHGWKDWLGFGNKDGVPNASRTKSKGRPSISGYHPPMSWHQPVPNGRPLINGRSVPWYNSYGRNQPVLPSYRHSGSRLLSKHNPMNHYTSYADNYRHNV